MIEYAFFVLAVTALITRYIYLITLKKSIYVLPTLLAPVLDIADSLLKAGTKSLESMVDTITTDLNYLSDSCQHAQLRLYLINKLFESKKSKNLTTEEIENKYAGLIEFYRNSNESHRDAMLWLLSIQTKILAVACHPCTHKGNKKRLLKISQVQPTSSVSLISNIEKIYEAGLDLNIDCSGYKKIINSLLENKQDEKSASLYILSNYKPNAMGNGCKSL